MCTCWCVSYIKVNVSPLMSHGGQCDHSSSSRVLHPLQQQAGQQEVAQVINTKLHAEAILCPTVTN